MVSKKEDAFLEAYNNKINVFEHKVYSHASNNEWVADPYIGFRLKKLKKKINNNLILDTNYLGLRAENNFYTKNYNSIFLGGSLVYGAYSPTNSSTISSFFEKYVGLDCLNGGIGGHVLKQHFSLYFNYLNGVETKNIIILFGFNDMGNCFNGKFYNDIKLDIFQKKINLITQKPFVEGLKISLSEILKYLKLKNLASILLKKKLITHKFSEIDVSKYLDQLCLNIKWFNENIKNKKVYFFIQPNLVTTKKKLTIYENNVISSRQIEKIEFCKNFYLELRKKTKEISNVLSLEDVFNDNKDTIFIDEAHVGDKGNEIIAKKIYKLINNG